MGRVYFPGRVRHDPRGDDRIIQFSMVWVDYGAQPCLPPGYGYLLRTVQKGMGLWAPFPLDRGRWPTLRAWTGRMDRRIDESTDFSTRQTK